MYSGNFAMPGQASTLVINTGAADDDGFDKDYALSFKMAHRSLRSHRLCPLRDEQANEI